MRAQEKEQNVDARKFTFFSVKNIVLDLIEMNYYNLQQNVWRCLVHSLHIRQCNVFGNILLQAIDTRGVQ